MKKSLYGPQLAAAATAGIAVAAFVGLGLVAANAGNVQAGIAPTLSCPNSDRLILPHGAGDQALGADLTPTQLTNAYVATTPGWTQKHASVARTVERAIAYTNPQQQVEVDVRNAAGSRVAMFVASKADSGWTLTQRDRKSVV